MDTPKENTYDAQIAPLMTQIIDLCRANKINMFATFVLDNHGGEDGALCCTTAISTNDPSDFEGAEMVSRLSRARRKPVEFAALTIFGGPAQ